MNDFSSYQPNQVNGKVNETAPSVAIVGGGPCGSLASIYFAQRGWQVTLIEKRPDLRMKDKAMQRSTNRTLNLALSTRGLYALAQTKLGLEKSALAQSVPISGRMIHTESGSHLNQPYGLSHQHNNSMNRNLLNDIILTAAEKFPNLNVVFDQELTSCDLNSGELKFKSGKDGCETKYRVDFIVGADGLNSTVRKELIKLTKRKASKEVLEHGYCELTIPAAKKKSNKVTGFEKLLPKPQMDPHKFHIWPRSNFMMTGLVNLDNSFSCALFAPHSEFKNMDISDNFLTTFRKEMKDVMSYVDEKEISKQFSNNPRVTLATVKCETHHYKGRAVILGDAAHCIVPFFGQGLNCALEDVPILFKFLDKLDMTKYDPALMEQALEQYSNYRIPDTNTIASLSLHNYDEMRYHVTSLSYQIRKQLISVLYQIMPSHFVPIYVAVTFSTGRYSIVNQQWRSMNKVLDHLTILAVVAITLFILKLFNFF